MIRVEIGSERDASTALAIGTVVEDHLAEQDGFGVLDALGFAAKAGEVRGIGNSDGGTTFVVGLGPSSDVTPAVVRKAASSLAMAASHITSLCVDLFRSVPSTCDRSEALNALAEGLVLGAYEYNRYKEGTAKLEEAQLLIGDFDGARVVEEAVQVAGAVCLARDLVNEPAGSMTATRFAEIAVELGNAHGFGVEVWEKDRIEAERLGGLIGVNRGSTAAPRFVTLSYRPEGATRELALVGKGITFDSGGLSLKTADGMIGMKGDMAGAAAVLAAFTAFAVRGVGANVTGYLPLTDNMIGPDATRVGDVLTIRNGKTVEVVNTDAEGRLVLADALSLAGERTPDAIVNIATLTGAVVVALGHGIAGLMGNDDQWIDQVRAAAELAGESFWPLPLPEAMRTQLDSPIADLKNVSSDRYGGALIAGIFLREFIPDGISWAHLDIAGPGIGWPETSGEPKGATGFGVRTFLRLAESF
jgi:leucyl aminopeptidase